MSASKSRIEKKAPLPGDGSYLNQQKRQYLIASRAGMYHFGLMAPGPQSVANQLKALGIEFEVVKTLHGRAATPPLSSLALGAARGPEILVARLNPESGETLCLQSAGGLSPLIVERDAPLTYGTATSLTQTLLATSSACRMERAKLHASRVRLQVLGEEDKPLGGVVVSIYGVGLPAEAVTNSSGQAELTFHTARPGQAQAVMARPRKEYWDLVIRDVELRQDASNIIRLRSFNETLPRYSSRPFLSWGQELMVQSQFNGAPDGQGVKIAVIDSGCDNTHPLLQHITLGTDVTEVGQSLGWTLDEIGHGTRCAGIIGARPARGCAMRGFAPGADLRIFKVFPGGRLSDLINALDQCIDNGVDIVNVSLGTEESSFLVEQKLQEARQRGIACIVAAGNSGGEVQYPARSPHVLAVAAIGRQADFPADSTHALTVTRIRTLDGAFSPSFTCHGPEIGVCAPGVAVISTVPGAGFDAMDGTSMAASHITGLAAVLLAQHPWFKSGPGKERSAQRVETLFGLLKQNAMLLPFGVERTGAGLPTLAAFGLRAFAGSAEMQLSILPQQTPLAPGLFTPQPQSTMPGSYRGATALQ